MKHPLISNNIKVLMKFSGFSAQDFADKFEVKRGTIESYVQGRATPKPELVQRICNYYGITQDQLLKQKLTSEDLKVTGRVNSVTEVRLAEALKQIALLEEMNKDKAELIELLRRNGR